VVPPPGRTLASPREGGGLSGADLGSTSFSGCFGPLGDTSQTEGPALVNVAKTTAVPEICGSRRLKSFQNTRNFERRPGEERVTKELKMQSERRLPKQLCDELCGEEQAMFSLRLTAWRGYYTSF
jgi:hypothetical protein